MTKNRRRIPAPQPEPPAALVQEDAVPESEPQAAPQAETETEKDSNHPEKPSLSQKIASLIAGLPTQKAKRITGFLCLTVSMLLFLAMLSHFFYWWMDYDVVQQMQKGSIWSDNGWQVRNFGGRLGAYISYALVNQGFGLASFFLPIALFLAGIHILGIRQIHWRRTILQMLFGLLWISIFLGSIFNGGSNYIFGGSAGMYASRYLQGLIGKVGLVLLLAFLLACYLIASYNMLKIQINRRKSPRPASVPSLSASPAYGQQTASSYRRPQANDLQENHAFQGEDDDLDSMTLSTRLRQDGFRTSPASRPADPTESLHNQTQEPEFELHIRKAEEMPAQAPANPGRIVYTLENEDEEEDDSIPTASHQQSPVTDKEETRSASVALSLSAQPEADPAGKEEDTESEEAELEVIDLRANQEQAAATGSATPRPDHFGIDTPFDPRLELSDYQFPTLNLLEDFGDQSQKIQDMEEELVANKDQIVNTLLNYGIAIDKISATIGPTVTLYEIVPAPGVRISKIKNLEDDIALSLSALGIRIIAPIPGKGTIGIEVPNRQKQIVPMRDMLTSDKFLHSGFALPVALGKTISNEVFVADLAKMPHLLVAGATGQGKSVGLNAIIASLLYSKHPAELKFVMVDPKKVELSLFNKIERQYLAKLPDSEEAVITDTRKVVRTLNSLCIEMDSRYDLLKEAGAKNIKEYNKKFISRRLNPEEGHRFLPYIVLIIDEFADLIMTAGKEVELPIARLAQLARAIGIHLVIATQRPSVNIITGLIKANFPARIAFKVSQKIDSRTILDAGGADQLIGRGDMLISMGEGLKRLQCAFIDTPEIERITEFIGSQRGYPTAYLLPECPDENGEGGKAVDMEGDEWDSLFKEAAEMVVSSQQGSTSMLQRKFKLGYNRAGRIMDQLEAAGIVGAFDGKKTREVRIKDPAALEVVFKTLNL